jgi:hypothetical protein
MEFCEGDIEVGILLNLWIKQLKKRMDFLIQFLDGKNKELGRPSILGWKEKKE